MSSFDSAVCTELLADRRRRDVLIAVRRMGPDPVCVRVLVDLLLGTDEPPAESPDRQHSPDRYHQTSRQRLLIELVHSHLPKLAAAGLIEYDPDGLRVRYRAHPQVDTLVDAVASEIQSASDQALADRTITTPAE